MRLESVLIAVVWLLAQPLQPGEGIECSARYVPRNVLVLSLGSFLNALLPVAVVTQRFKLTNKHVRVGRSARACDKRQKMRLLVEGFTLQQLETLQLQSSVSDLCLGSFFIGRWSQFGLLDISVHSRLI